MCPNESNVIATLLPKTVFLVQPNWQPVAPKQLANGSKKITNRNRSRKVALTTRKAKQAIGKKRDKIKQPKKPRYLRPMIPQDESALDIV